MSRSVFTSRETPWPTTWQCGLVKLGIAKNGSGKTGRNPEMISSRIFGESFSICKLSGCHLGLSKIRHRYPQILYFTHPSCHLGAPYVWRTPFGDRYACLIKLFKDMVASGFTVRYGKIIIYTRYINCDCNLLEGIAMTIPYVIPIKSPLLMVKSQAMLVQQQFMLVKSVI